MQFLQLQHGRDHADLLEVSRTDALIDRLEALDLLSSDRARVLRAGWDFLQRLASRLRIVENRSISDLDERKSELDSVTRALGYGGSGRVEAARHQLLDDYRRHTEAIRRVYLDVLGVE